MVDLKKEFKTFHDRIALTSAKKSTLRKARNALREKVRKYFRETLKLAIPKFQGQGSYAMVTTVNPLNGEFDIDDGVYLQHLDTGNKKEWPTPETVHRWLVQATDGHTSEKPMDKRTCVRVRYAGQYHVDLPAYGELSSDYLLVEKGDKGWHKSDPLALTNWFRDRVKYQGEQLRRMVRFLKAWADFQSGRLGVMPSGLILTVLVSNQYSSDESDDIALANTVNNISNAIKFSFSVYNPVDISEELTARLTEAQKKRFQKAISDAADAAAEAIRIDDRHEASKIWRKQFGDRFPAVEKEDEKHSKKESVTKLAAVYAAQKPSKPWGFRR